MTRRESSTRFIITVSAALLDWVIIAATIYAAECVATAWGTVIAIIIIASRQQALGVIAHEAIHWPKGYLQRSVTFTLKLLCAWPILMHFSLFRSIHLAHHRHLNSELDPDFARNQPMDLQAADSLWQIVRYGLGLNRRTTSPAPRRQSGLLRMSTGMALFWSTALALVWISHGMQVFLCYWVLPLFTWFIVLVRLRGILEHTGIDASVAQKTRTIRGNFISNFLFLPHAIGIHGEHHRNPEVPFYRLRRLHFTDADWHTSRGIIQAAFEILASTALFRKKFARGPRD